MINRDNFFNKTYGVWKQIGGTPNRQPEFVSASGSEYWYEGDFIIRKSSHWSGYMYGHAKRIEQGCIRVATCKWYLRMSNDDYRWYYIGKIHLNKFKVAFT